MIDLEAHILNSEIPAVAVGFDHDCDVEKITTLKKQGLDIAEIRVDLFKEGASSEKVIKALQNFNDLDVPTILTFRSKREGGNWNGSDLERAKLISECYKYADVVDIESSSMHSSDCDSSEQFCQLANEVLESKTQLLISYHNFDKTPSLDEINHKIESAEKLLSAKADIVKVACQVDSNMDVSVLTEMLMQSPNRNLVVIGMGWHGLITRLSFHSYGSLFTFAYVDDTITAPGQLHIDTIVKYLRAFYPIYNQNFISKNK